PATLFLDTEVVHGGDGAGRIERDANSDGQFSSLTQEILITFSGREVELRGFLKADGVEDGTGLWLRQDGNAGPMGFTSMLAEDRGVRGTADWAPFSVRLPLDRKAKSLAFGALLQGPGRVWLDDLELRVDGKPLAQAPERVVETTVLDTDTEFAAGSRITLSSVSPAQARNLVLLGRVWGFLKYHHPRIAAGELHWDYELFRVMPKLLAAEDAAGGQRVLATWVETLGAPPPCDPCPQPPKDDLHYGADLDWIEDVGLLGADLSEHLRGVYARRFSGEGGDEPFFVQLAMGVRNPVFDRELPHGELKPLDAGYRLLAVFRLWNIIEYWFPYRDLLEGPWVAVLEEFVPRIVGAANWDAYRLEMLAMVAHIHDSHANLWQAHDVRPPVGTCRWPVALRWIEGAPTVTALLGGGPGGEAVLEVGDVVRSVDGRDVPELVAEWSPYYPASNAASRFRGIARALPLGPCGDSSLEIERSGERRTLKVPRVEGVSTQPVLHDRPGDTFQMLSDDIAYLKLSSVKVKDLPGYLEQAAETKGLLVDIRNYPSEFVVFALGQRLVRESTPFVRFTQGNLSNPGAFTFTEALSLAPVKPTYGGRVAILVDESSISQSEYTAMALSTAPGAVVVGSTTAGADGNVSPIPLPGGLRTMISGIGVFYPDKTPTQRVGIVPDIAAEPTVRGIRQGRDEVLEAAIRELLGPEADEAEIRRMARRP
ncbi:MAG: S41 family peptidase, partial [Acidobacteriota bacterium]